MTKVPSTKPQPVTVVSDEPSAAPATKTIKKKTVAPDTFSHSSAAVGAKPSAASQQALSSLDQKVFTAVKLDKNGKTAPIHIDVPPDAISVAVFVRGQKDQNYVVGRYADAKGRELISDHLAPKKHGADDASQSMSPNRTHFGIIPGRASALIPNNPDIQLQPGPATLVVQGFEAAADKTTPGTGSVDVTVIVKRAPAEPRAGRIALHIYVPKGFTYSGDNFATKKLSATSAVKDPTIQAALEKARGIFSAAGIDIADVQFHDLGRKVPVTPLSSEESAALAGSGEHQSGIGVYLTAALDGANGITTALPGVPAAVGTPASGIVIGNFAEGEGDHLGIILAHELGHHLGLYHTEDASAGLADPISDTGTDFENMMAPKAGDMRVAFSRGQGKVMLLHPDVAITRTKPPQS